MFEEIQVFAGMMFQGFARLLPYVLLTIPIAVAVQMSGAAKHIRKAFAARPVPAIILATIVGAFSPFCSCGVVATLGWNLALWRLLSTLVLSLSAGFITHMAVRKGWISGPILRSLTVDPRQSLIATVRTGYRWLRGAIWRPAPVLATEFCCGGHPQEDSGEGNRFTTNRVFASATQSPGACSSAGSCEAGAESSPWPPAPSGAPPSFGHRLLREGGSAALLVGKFMLLALVLETLFSLYVPREWVVAVVGQSSRLAILTAAVVGVPLYTSNLTALPMIGALLGQGMNPSAALAFLIAGPTTTIPAMAAVWGLVHRRVFALYVAFALIGAVLAGILHRIATVL
jgi:uncharacterized membrane protein YraQ (UPF0718 family)